MNEEIGAKLAFINALLNGSSGVLLFCGWLAIRRQNRDLHRRFMVSAFAVSSLFLICYLVRVWISGTHRYPGTGIWKMIYFSVLLSHMVLAVATPPLAIRSIFLAWKSRFAEHRRLVRFTFPIWMYVSVTGVVVYLMLYHPPG